MGIKRERPAFARLSECPRQQSNLEPRYAAHGRIHTGGRARDQLVADWAAARDPACGVMLAYRREDVAELNRRARTIMVDRGDITGPELRIGGRGFAAGDHVVLRRNDRRLGVANGDAELPRRHLDGVDRPGIQHGYALTGHTAQGVTVDRAYVLGTEETGREWLDTALSRGRLENRLYGSSPLSRERDDIAPAEPSRGAAEVLELAVRRSAAQSLAIERRGRTRTRGRELEL